MAEDTPLPIPNLKVPQYIYILNQPALASRHKETLESLLAAIQEDEMGPFYAMLTTLHPTIIPQDKSVLSALQEKNTARLAELDKKLEEAQKTEGETEVSDTIKEKANYLVRIGEEKDKVVKALEEALEKTSGAGSKIDLVLTLLRIAFFWGDFAMIDKELKRSDELIQKGGDWDRLNRLKVYRALHLISVRQFGKSAELFIDALSTFTATELMDYKQFVEFTIISGAVSLSRVDLKKKILAAPEVLQLLSELPVLRDLITSLYDCHYDKFFVALASLPESTLLPSLPLSPHSAYIVRELRIKAYNQLLASYASLSLDALAQAFGVSKAWVETDLARFTSTARIHCTIDSVNDIVSTTRPSVLSSQFDQVIKVGDSVLDGVGRLGRGLY
ncbi:26S proteasome subunit RPN7-domain-containing protein [Schizophyllum amplum]|uniref:26S proteasome subunit RPN7-domain-containing protein n=1 Tax=Schizophyllum amplum TaxID=97359 RepID=A0A550CFW4_9AGAR|nr:26S proteasome subunit RPN7-domain-containing protein [Auriculariopsis ampla]